MAKVLCSLPNAATEINGIKFTVAKGGMISEDVSDDVANDFVSIPGYELVSKSKATAKAAAKNAPATEPAIVAEPEVAEQAATEPAEKA